MKWGIVATITLDVDWSGTLYFSNTHDGYFVPYTRLGNRMWRDSLNIVLTKYLLTNNSWLNFPSDIIEINMRQNADNSD